MEPPSAEIDAVLGAFNQGRVSEAEARALAMTRAYPQAGIGWRVLGIVLAQQGRVREALAPVQRTAELFPNDAEAHNNLGTVLQGLGRSLEAEASFRRAIALRADYAEAYNNLGAALRSQGRWPEAEAGFREAIALRSAYAEAYGNLGILLREMGRLAEAEASLGQAITLKPAARTLSDLGVTLQDMNRPDEAEAALRQAIALQPGYAEAHHNLGGMLHRLGRLAEAEAAFRQAVAVKSAYPEAHYGLGMLLADVERAAEAEVALRRAISLKPGYADAYNQLTSLLKRQNRLAEAEANARRAAALFPGNAETYNNLSTTLVTLGQMADAEASIRRALDIAPDYARAHQNLIFTLDLMSSTDTASQQAERRRWAARFAPAARSYPPFTNSPDPARRLRIGYVSSDFERHSAATVFGAMLLDFDADQFEVFAYSNLIAPDEVTALFRSGVSQWRDIARLSDDAVAGLIREDRIDILVDLSGHSAGDRLGVFARKPAPIQITAWGYLTGTGMEAMDVIFSDPVLIPEDEKRFFAEEVRYLPNAISASFFQNMPDVGALPASANDGIVFGSFNRVCKVSDEAFAVWVRVLHAVPGSKFIIKTAEVSDSAVRYSLLKRFTGAGIEPQRLVFMGKTSWYDHLAAFNKVDIALDPFPHGGGVTTLEGLMMGVPVVTLKWPTIVGRLSATILTALGLTDWIAATPDDYVAIAVRKAANARELAELRQGLRPRMRASIIGDTRAYVAAVEREYRALWKAWCARPA